MARKSWVTKLEFSFKCRCCCANCLVRNNEWTDTLSVLWAGRDLGIQVAEHDARKDVRIRIENRNIRVEEYEV